MVTPTIDPAHPSIDPAHLGQLETALERELSERKKAKWAPRKYQEAAWNYLRTGGKRAYLVWHRRAGKDDVCLRHTLQALQERPGGYWYLLPQQEQARKAIWRAVDPHKGKRRIDISFPPALREKTLDQEMLIQFKNSSTWQVLGSDNYNALVGSPPIGIVFSEWPLSDPQAWSYLAPILEENGGWAVFNGTPRGPNHGKTLFEHANRNPDWYCEKLTADETGVFTPAQLERIEQEYIGLHGEDHGRSIFQQEYMCSFTAAVLGTYYGAEMAALERQGRICGVPYDHAARVTTAWDIGIGDATAIWFFQQVGKEVHVIDYYEAAGQGLDHYVKVIEKKGYFYQRHILPHDVQARELGIGKTRLEHLESLGMRRGIHGPIDIAPRQQDEEGINAARMLLPKCWFDAVKCRKGIEALKLFRTEWDQDKRVFKRKALHDWTSHAADAFAYLALTIDSGAGETFHRKLVYPKQWIA
jgi:hypothetical protein